MIGGHLGGSLTMATFPLISNSCPNPEAYRTLVSEPAAFWPAFSAGTNALELNDNRAQPPIRNKLEG